MNTTPSDLVQSPCDVPGLPQFVSTDDDEKHHEISFTESTAGSDAEKDVFACFNLTPEQKANLDQILDILALAAIRSCEEPPRLEDAAQGTDGKYGKMRGQQWT